jgi:arsenite methyltransferase
VADVITSNCVLNLLPQAQKPQVFFEIHRLLKPGGRLAISDILAHQALPEGIRNDAVLYVGCVSGASLVGEYEGWLKDAGFKDVLILDTRKDLNIYKEGILRGEVEAEPEGGGCCMPKTVVSAGCCSVTPTPKKSTLEYDLNEWVGKFYPVSNIKFRWLMGGQVLSIFMLLSR